MKKKQFKEAMENWKEGSKASSYLDLLAKSKVPMKLYKGRNRKTGNYSFGS